MLKNSSTSGLNYLKWQNLTGATRKCTWSRGVVATFSWMRTYSQNSKNPSSVTGKSSIYRKGGTVETNCWNTDVRAAERQHHRGDTPKSSQTALNGHAEETTAVLRALHQLFFTQKWEESVLQGTELYKRQQMQPPFPTEMKSK